MSQGWIGVDLDGTLAHYDEYKGPTHIGEPIMRMVGRVKNWLAEGKEVRIFTARVYVPSAILGDNRRWIEALNARVAIKNWCERHLGQVLEITCTKDFDMIEFWDDRAVQVEKNTGRTVVEVAEQGRWLQLETGDFEWKTHG